MRKKHGRFDREISRVLAYYRAAARRSNSRRERPFGTPGLRVRLRNGTGFSLRFLQRLKALVRD